MNQEEKTTMKGVFIKPSTTMISWDFCWVKRGASKICVLQTYFTQWASDLYINSCCSLVKE